MYIFAPCIYVTVVGSLVYDLSCIYLLQRLGHSSKISRDIFVTVVGSMVYDMSLVLYTVYIFAPCIFVTVVGSLVYYRSYCTPCMY